MAGIAIGLVALVVVAILLLQVDGITTRLLSAAGRFLPWDDASLEADHASLSGLSRLKATNLRVTAADGRPLLTIDSIDLSIRPLALLARRVDIPGLRVTGVRAIVRQRADSSWDLLEPFVAPEDTAPSGEPMMIRIGAAEIRHVTITGYYAGTPDSLRIDDLVLRLGQLRSGSAIAFTLDTLHARIMAPGRARPAVLSGRARLSEGLLTVAGFRLRSDSSDVVARGNLMLPGPTAREIRDVDFRLAAEPLDFRDIAPLVPKAVTLPPSMRLAARVTGRSSLLRVDMNGRTSDGATVALDGLVTPGTSGPVRYELEGTIQGLDPRMLGIVNARGRTSAELELALSGDTLSALNGTIEVRLGGLDLGDVEVAPTRLTARVENGLARYRLDGALLPWARLAGDGTLTLFRDLPSYSLSLRMVQARAVPDSGPVQVRDVTALLRAEGRGFSELREGRAVLQLEQGRVGDAAIARGGGEVRWGQNRATAVLSAHLTGEQPVLDTIGAKVEWRAGTADIGLAIAGLDVQAASPRLPTSSLNGAGRFAVRPGPIARMAGRGRFEVHGSTLGTDSLGPGRLAIELEHGLVTLEGTLQALDGSVQLAGSARPFDPVPSFGLDRARFDDVALEELSGGRVRHPLSGILTARGTLPPDSLPQVTGRVDLDGGPFNRGRLDTLHAEFRLTGRQVRVEATARTGEGTLMLTGETVLLPDGDNGSATWSLGPTTVDTRFDLPDLAVLIADTGAGQLSGRIQLAGQGTDAETMQWDGRAELSGRWEQARLDLLRLEGRIAEGRLTVDTLRIESNLLHGAGGGSTSLSGPDTSPRDTVVIRLVADTTAPATLSGLLGIDPLSTRVGRMELLAWQAERKLQLRARVSFGGLIAGAGGADSLDLNAGAALSQAGVTDVNGTVTGFRVAWSRLELERLDAKVESDGNRFTLEARAVRDDAHEFNLAAHGVTGERQLFLSSFGFGFGDIEWALRDTASVSWGDRIVISDFDLRNGARRIVVEGHLDREASQALSIRLDSVPLQPFAEFAGIDGMDAQLNGTLRVDGPAARPGLHTSLRLSVQTVVAHLQTRPSGDQLAVDFDLTAQQGESLTVRGTVPNRLSLLADPPEPSRAAEAVGLVIRSAGFPLDWLSPFLQGFGVDRLGGRLEADARIEGTVASPRASGSVGLADGRIRMPQQGVDYQRITGRLSLTGNRLQVTSWRIDADGSAGVEGHLLLQPLDDPRLDLRVRFDGFRAIRNELVRLGLTGDASVTGTLSRPRLSGSLTLEKTDIYADRVGQTPAVRPVTLTERDYQMLESYFGYRRGDALRPQRDLLEPWGIELDVQVGGDVWLRKQGRPEVRVLLSGSLDVRKQPGDSLQLFGTVEAVPTRSIVEQFGKRFAIDQGTITFNGPLTSWRADIEARYDVPAYRDPGATEVVITLSAQGGANDLRLTLGSEPAMETADVISYLATGRPARNAELSDQSSAVAVGALAEVLEDEAGQQIGLDVMEIRQDPAEGTLVIAGRYVSPRLYVGFQQPVTRGDRQEGLNDQHQGTQVELEYTLYRWLLLNLQGGSEFRWFFRTRYAF